MEKRGIAALFLLFLLSIIAGYFFSIFTQPEPDILSDEETFESYGWLLYYNADYDGSLEEFKSYIVRNPENYVAHIGLGWTYSRQGEYEKSVEAFNKASQLRPQDYRSYEGIGWVNYISFPPNAHEFRSRIEQSIEAFEKSIGLNPNNANLFAGLGSSQAYHNLLSPVKEVSDYSSAKENLAKAISLSPDFPDHHSALGWILFLENFPKAHDDPTKNFEESLKSIDRALQYSSDNFLVYQHAGYVYTHLGRFEEAQVFWNNLLEIVPYSPDALYGLAYISFFEGDNENALKYLEQHNSVAEYRHPMEGYIHLQQKNFETAKRTFENSLQTGLYSESAYDGLGLYYMHRKNYDLAIHMFESSLYHDPQTVQESFTSTAYLGWAYYQKGDYDQALTLFKETYELSLPTEKSTTLSRIYALMGLVSVHDRLDQPQEAGAYARELEETIPQIGSDFPPYFLYHDFRNCMNGLQFTPSNIHQCSTSSLL